MKLVAVLMVILVVAAAVLGIYTVANARLRVLSVSMDSVSAAERPEEFAALQTAMDQGALMGIPFVDSLPGNSLDYSFFTFTFRLKNTGLVDAEMVEITPVPSNGDVLCYTTMDESRVNENLTVHAGKERDAWCVVLTSAQNEQLKRAPRSFRVTYYIWGKPRTLTVMYP